MSIPLPPLPEPDKSETHGFEGWSFGVEGAKKTSDHTYKIHWWREAKMHAHAAAVSAAKDAEIAALRAEVAGLREDAERYKYLRDVAWHGGSLIFYAERYGPEDWDAHIDAELAARKGTT